ncbi:hypothetical protein [Rhodococcus sp. MEB064]|uniref:hypothetical protein n=1 Tax=Rhodococcus sp. MEB064 TaxID=1587522 RepID=UPI0005AC701C|nr:hypothetical protein [Rhodococcus sp. MEB064]KIQ08021.1 hypothetical protein RU01_21725 [Rhodococcus sp. MEB064]
MYGVHKLLWDIRRDGAVKTLYIEDPTAALDRYGVEEPLRTLMAEFDIKGLYEAGVNPYLLYFCAIQLEVNRADYYARIRGEKTP